MTEEETKDSVEELLEAFETKCSTSDSSNKIITQKSDIVNYSIKELEDIILLTDFEINLKDIVIINVDFKFWIFCLNIIFNIFKFEKLIF